MVLMIDAKNAHAEATRLLLENRADINATDEMKHAALMMASYGSYKTCDKSVKVLIEAGANINMKDDKGTSALMLAKKSRS